MFVIFNVFSYDRAGNRISKEIIGSNGTVISKENYSYDRQNKLLYVDGLKELFGEEVYGRVRFEYDKRGNTTRIKDSSKVLGEYEFSKENLLAKATNRRGEVTSFGYDGAGRRVRVKVEKPNEKLTKEYKYINDPTTPYSTILMRYGKDKQTEKYIHGIGHESTEKLNQWKETERTFYTHNELGSQIREYDAKGTSINSYEYDIFGVPSFREDGYNYTGYTNDSSTNLMFAQARYYLPETGRFISEDSYKGTLDDTQSQHRYIYCANNPLKYIDPSGHFGKKSQSWLQKGVGGIGSLLNSNAGEFIDEDTDEIESAKRTKQLTLQRANEIVGNIEEYSKDQAVEAGFWYCAGGVVKVGGKAVVKGAKYVGGKVKNVGKVFKGIGRKVEGIVNLFGKNAKHFDNGGVLDKASFAQKTFRRTFSDDGIEFYSKIAGKRIENIDDLVKALKSGKVSTTQIPIDYINKNGNTLILNTRSSQALIEAGIPRSEWNAVNRTGEKLYEEMLDGQLKRNKLTDKGIEFVKPSGGKK